VLKVIAVYL